MVSRTHHKQEIVCLLSWETEGSIGSSFLPRNLHEWHADVRDHQGSCLGNSFKKWRPREFNADSCQQVGPIGFVVCKKAKKTFMEWTSKPYVVNWRSSSPLKGSLTNQLFPRTQYHSFDQIKQSAWARIELKKRKSMQTLVRWWCQNWLLYWSPLWIVLVHLLFLQCQVSIQVWNYLFVC